MNHCELFIQYLKTEKRYSKHTLSSYQTDLKQFFKFCEQHAGKIPLGSISHRLIRKWIVSLLEAGLTTRSVNRKISTLKSFFKYLLRHNQISHNPLEKVSTPKTGKRLPAFVSEKGLKLLLSESTREVFAENFAGLRDRLIVELLYSTGLRLSELIGLKHNDIDWHRQLIGVTGKGNKQRQIPIPTQLPHTLKKYEQAKSTQFAGHPPSQHLLVSDKGNKLYPKLVYRKVHLYLSLISNNAQKSPHTLRHSFASHLLNHGADLNAIKKLLGHTTLAATQVYTHNSFEHLKSIYQKAHPRAANYKEDTL